jgi:hypothetical protein
LQKVDECHNLFELPQSAKKWKRHIMLPVQKMKLRRDSLELLYVECAYPAQGLLKEGTCFKFKRLQEMSIEGARREPESILENTIEAFEILEILQVREEVKSRRIDAKIFGKKSLRT